MAAFANLPPQLQERIVCSVAAAVRYEVPVNIVLAIAEKEGGRPGQWVRNSNGTDDVGPMQFNTAYLSDLARYGISATDVSTDGCYSFDLAAWRLRMQIRKDQGDLWTKAANYHSRTPKFNAVYRADLMRRAVKWADWLDAHFVTRDVMKAGVAPSAPDQTARSPSVPQQVAPYVKSNPAAAKVRNVTVAAYVPRTVSFKP